MTEAFDKDFRVAGEKEKRVFHFQRIMYANSLMKYSITPYSGNPVNMVRDKNNRWVFEYKFIVVPVYMYSLEDDFAKAIEENESGN